MLAIGTLTSTGSKQSTIRNIIGIFSTLQNSIGTLSPSVHATAFPYAFDVGLLGRFRTHHMCGWTAPRAPHRGPNRGPQSRTPSSTVEYHSSRVSDSSCPGLTLLSSRSVPLEYPSPEVRYAWGAPSLGRPVGGAYESITLARVAFDSLSAPSDAIAWSAERGRPPRATVVVMYARVRRCTSVGT